MSNIKQLEKDLDRIDEIINTLSIIYDEKLEQLKDLESEKSSKENA
jgi:ribosome assembly protein YihI (activator of Der GTPase)